jgi:MFS-type transporter involved in bile tolerance (Atg22 family)
MGPGWPTILLYVLFALLGAATGAWAGLLLAESARLAPHGQTGAATSGVMIYVNAGKFLGPVVAANIYALTSSYGLSFASMIVPAIFGICCLARVSATVNSIKNEKARIPI